MGVRLCKSPRSLVQAVAVEPEFPLAHSALSDAWNHLGYNLKARDEAEHARGLSGHLGPRRTSADRRSVLFVDAGYESERSSSYRNFLSSFRTIWITVFASPMSSDV